jgi:hypothetical protein
VAGLTFTDRRRRDGAGSADHNGNPVHTGVGDGALADRGQAMQARCGVTTSDHAQVTR